MRHPSHSDLGEACRECAHKAAPFSVTLQQCTFHRNMRAVTRRENRLHLEHLLAMAKIDAHYEHSWTDAVMGEQMWS